MATKTGKRADIISLCDEEGFIVGAAFRFDALGFSPVFLYTAMRVFESDGAAYMDIVEVCSVLSEKLRLGDLDKDKKQRGIALDNLDFLLKLQLFIASARIKSTEEFQQYLNALSQKYPKT